MKNRWQRKDRRRRVMCDRYASLRLRLKAVYHELSGVGIADVTSAKGNKAKVKAVGSSESVQLASLVLSKLRELPRDSNPVRVKNRCVQTGVGSSVMRKFRLSRFAVRSMAMDGMRPGYRKASW